MNVEPAYQSDFVLNSTCSAATLVYHRMTVIDIWLAMVSNSAVVLNAVLRGWFKCSIVVVDPRGPKAKVAFDWP